MRQKLLGTLCLTLLIFAVSVAFAQTQSVDDQGNPNDPRINPRANACYAGASMEGKCHIAGNPELTDWHWTAGWYLIRFEYGLISRADFPQAYADVLPPEPIIIIIGPPK
jgi:hypothetical protein